MYKKYISCEPDIYNYEIDEDDEYLILASDGLWNELTHDNLLKIINNHGKLEGLSLALMQEATNQKKLSTDNISLIIIDLKRLKKHNLREEESAKNKSHF